MNARRLAGCLALVAAVHVVAALPEVARRAGSPLTILVLSTLPGIAILAALGGGPRLPVFERLALVVLLSWSTMIAVVGALHTFGVDLTRWTMLGALDAILAGCALVVLGRRRHGGSAADAAVGRARLGRAAPLAAGLAAAAIGTSAVIGVAWATAPSEGRPFVAWSIDLPKGPPARSPDLWPVRTDGIADFTVSLVAGGAAPFGGDIDLLVDDRAVGGRSVDRLVPGERRRERLRAEIPLDGCSHRLTARFAPATGDAPGDLILWTRPRTEAPCP